MLQIAVCDDEQQDLERLRTMLEAVMEKHSVRYQITVYDSGEELLESALMFQLIFMDIMMKGMNGIETGKKIYRKNPAIKIIFQTNFSQYCGDAVNKSHAFAFLEKPIRQEQLEEQIKEFFEGNENVQEMWMDFKHIRYKLEGEEIEKEILRLPVREIIYLQYVKSERCVRLVTERGEFIFSGAMKVLEEKMIPLGFEVCSRGILVNMDKITRIKGTHIMLNNGCVIPLSQRRIAYFKERMNEFAHYSFPMNHG